MTDIPTHIQPRVVALLRKMGAQGAYSIDTDDFNEIDAIVAELPEPPDPLLIEARKLVAAQYTFGSKTYSAVMEGGFDNSDGLKVALAALRRGVEIGRGGE